MATLCDDTVRLDVLFLCFRGPWWAGALYPHWVWQGVRSRDVSESASSGHAKREDVVLQPLAEQVRTPPRMLLLLLAVFAVVGLAARQGSERVVDLIPARTVTAPTDVASGPGRQVIDSIEDETGRIPEARAALAALGSHDQPSPPNVSTEAATASDGQRLDAVGAEEEPVLDLVTPVAEETVTSPAKTAVNALPASSSPESNTPPSAVTSPSREQIPEGPSAPTVDRPAPAAVVDLVSEAANSTTTTSQASTTTTTRVPTTTSSTTTTTRAPTTTTTTTTTQAPSTTTLAPRSSPLLVATFNSTDTGPYTSSDIRSDFGSVDFAATERVSVESEGGNNFLRVDYPRGGVGPAEGGAQFRTDFSASIGEHEELYLAYDVRFEEGFDFRLGGKLPGFGAGWATGGGRQPDGHNGFSTRMMWVEQGSAVSYVYHPDQPSKYGERFNWQGASFTPGQWTTVETRVRLNTPGQNDGIIEGWVDGQLVLRETGMRFRDTSDIKIEGLLFSTFFGGNTSDWAPSRDETIDFDNFIISQGPITH